jgi:hypothetical protein
MELMQVETSAPAAAPATDDMATRRAHGPGRRRRTGAAAEPAEPLVQVETGETGG